MWVMYSTGQIKNLLSDGNSLWPIIGLQWFTLSFMCYLSFHHLHNHNATINSQFQFGHNCWKGIASKWLKVWVSDRLAWSVVSCKSKFLVCSLLISQLVDSEFNLKHYFFWGCSQDMVTTLCPIIGSASLVSLPSLMLTFIVILILV